jgi:hypothetical protein
MKEECSYRSENECAAEWIDGPPSRPRRHTRCLRYPRERHVAMFKKINGEVRRGVIQIIPAVQARYVLPAFVDNLLPRLDGCTGNCSAAFHRIVSAAVSDASSTSNTTPWPISTSACSSVCAMHPVPSASPREPQWTPNGCSFHASALTSTALGRHRSVLQQHSTDRQLLAVAGLVAGTQKR